MTSRNSRAPTREKCGSWEMRWPGDGERERGLEVCKRGGLQKGLSTESGKQAYDYPSRKGKQAYLGRIHFVQVPCVHVSVPTSSPYLSVVKDGKNQCDSDEEEANISQKWSSVNSKWFNDTHRTDHTRHDEWCRSKKFPNGQASHISTHCRQRSKKRSFPKAEKVTPATFSSRPRSWAIDARLGVKKSDMLMPRVENRKKSHETRTANRHGRSTWSAQK